MLLLKEQHAFLMHYSCISKSNCYATTWCFLSGVFFFLRVKYNNKSPRLLNVANVLIQVIGSPNELVQMLYIYMEYTHASNWENC